MVYSRWKLRKYTAVAEAQAAQRQEMGTTGRTIRGRRDTDVNGDDDDIPFGIRAIESGIEVDGVWISRTNTPNQSAPGSPASEPSSFMGPAHPSTGRSLDRASSVSNVSHLEIPQPVHGYPAPSSTYSTRSSEISDAPFERGLSSEHLQTRNLSYQPESARISRSRPTYQPRHSSHLRFSNSQGYDYEHNNSAAMAALEGRSAGAAPGYDTSTSSSRSSS